MKKRARDIAENLCICAFHRQLAGSRQTDALLPAFSRQPFRPQLKLVADKLLRPSSLCGSVLDILRFCFASGPQPVNACAGSSLTSPSPP